MFASIRIATLSLSFLVVASVWANASGPASAATPSRLSALIGETSAQFRLAFRMRPNEAQLRQEQLDSAVAAWRAAPRSAASDDEFAKWLRNAIRASMPGQREPLPPIPEFTSGIRIEKGAELLPREPAPSEAGTPTSDDTPRLDLPAAGNPSAEPTPVVAPTTPSDEATDPFRDDPIEEPEQE